MLLKLWRRRWVLVKAIPLLAMLGCVAYYFANPVQCSADYNNVTSLILHYSVSDLEDHSSLSQVDTLIYNAAELLKLRHFLASEHRQVKAVIFIMARSRRIRKLLKTLRLLMRNFNRRHRYPIVLFHEAEFLPLTSAARNAGALSNGSCIFFQLLSLKTPDWLLKKFGDASQWSKLPPICNSSAINLGYRHMCRFQSKILYEQPVMDLFDYYWRLDDDSFIITTMPYDPFAQLRRAGCSYGYFQASIDECADRLFDIAKEYIASRSINATFFTRLKNNEAFFNNFEVSSMTFWRSQQYRDFIEHIDSLGGIYTHRWGDAPIKTLALSMFVPLREIYRFKNFTYLHHGIGDQYESGFLP